MSLDGSADLTRNTPNSSGRDPPPAWSGEDPLRWRQTRRDLLLWAADTETPASKQGTRFFRALSGRARQLCDGLEDQMIMAPDGLMYIVRHLDALYQGPLAIAKELEGERALFSGHRTGDENMVAYVARRQVEFSRYEAALGERLPEALKTKLIVKQAKLSTQQGHLLSTWTNGSRELSVVHAALCRLDTERELLGLSMGIQTGKDMFEHEGEEQPEVFLQRTTGEEADELLQLYEDPSHDVGEDSECEEYIWIYGSDMNFELDETMIDQQFANFARVQQQKAILKKSRGWFTPASWSESAAKGDTGKGKGKKGLSSSAWPSSSAGGGKGRGLSVNGKGKGKGKQQQRYENARYKRDER
eukprot:6465443-Amphidinium_carterae.1